MAEIQAFNWRVGALAPGSYTAPGILTGGDYDTENEELESVGIGAQGALRGGLIMLQRSIQIDLTPDSKTLIQKAVRAAQTSIVADMSVIQMQFGDNLKLITDFGYINQLHVEVEERNILKGSIAFRQAVKDSFVAGVPASSKHTIGAGPTTQIAITGDAFTFEDAVMTLDGGNAMHPLSLAIDLDNHFEVKSSLVTRTSGEKRYPTIIRMGPEEVTWEFGVQERYKDEVESGADALVAAAIVLTCTNGANTIVCTSSNAKLLSGPGVPFTTAAGEIIYKYRAKGVPNKTKIAIT